MFKYIIIKIMFLFIKYNYKLLFLLKQYLNVYYFK